jgi:hypothetical protein
MANITALRSYRCTYWPKDQNGRPVITDTGVLPFVRVRASNAEGAATAAHWATGCCITEVSRVEPVAHD